MKRGLSDTENEDDDVFEDDESEHRAGSPTQSCHVPDRKRRRGIIEKRRRDRINYSLTELKRLVPAAFEKQGSSKLEKAEILKMTVDHLKMLQSRGGTYHGFDPASVAMDFRSVGFRECAAEVARYLVAIEGLDSHDPLCVRLLSHLHYFPSTASSSSSAPSSSSTSGHVTNWPPNTTNRPPYAKPVTSLDAPYAKPVTSMVSAYNRQTEATNTVPSGSTAFVDYARFDDRTSGYGQFRFPNATSGMGAQHGGALVEGTAPQVATSVFAGLNSQFLNLDSSTFGYNNNNNNPSSSLSSSSLSSTSSLLQCLRPYRPWGVDLVY